MYKSLKPLCGRETEKLLDNPDRGFRIETKMNVLTCKEYDKDAFVLLDEFLDKYKEDRVKITQHYFYLTDYKDKDLDDPAFANMNKYFDLCRSRKIKVLLRFAYILHDTKWNDEDAETEQILRHIEQLEEFITKNRDIIYALQAGYLGPWGEWSGGAKQDRRTILNHILNNIPNNLPVMVRYVWAKNVLDEYDTRRARVSYHDDYIIDVPHQWNSGAKDDSPYYAQLTAESPYFTIDGEMPWAWDKTDFDGIAIAKRLAKHHFTSFSIEHNYKEHGGGYSIEQWKSTNVTPEILKANALPFNPNWFADGNGNSVERSCYEYIRDYLGYHLYAESADINKAEDSLEIKVKVINFGFSAPHSMKEFNIVLLDQSNKITASLPACKLLELQTNKEVECNAYFRSVASNAVKFGLELKDYAETGARTANDCEFINGINVLGEL